MTYSTTLAQTFSPLKCLATPFADSSNPWTSDLSQHLAQQPPKDLDLINFQASQSLLAKSCHGNQAIHFVIPAPSAAHTPVHLTATQTRSAYSNQKRLLHNTLNVPRPGVSPQAKTSGKGKGMRAVRQLPNAQKHTSNQAKTSGNRKGMRTAAAAAK
jgi:hypothetical protein